MYKLLCSSTKNIQKPWRLFYAANTSTYSTVTTPVKRYSLMLENGTLKPDQKQFAAVMKIQELYNELQSYDFSKLNSEAGSIDVQKGLYLHGGVGTGKTLLLDLFYDSMPTQYKKRVHFNAFMLYLYSEMNRWNLCVDDNVDFLSPTEHIANKIMQDTRLLCFDEIQLADYTSCTMLEGVFSHMIAKGAVIVGTSNRSPMELGDSTITDQFDGETSSVQESLMSFKNLFMDCCHVHYLESERDHRTEMKQGELRYHYPMNAQSEEILDHQFVKAISKDQKLTSATVELYGRKVLIPMSSGLVARFTFKDLCCQPLGPADYIKICNTYHTVFIDQIPKMSIHMKNEARRFLSFIDAAYECRVNVYCTSEASANELFTLLPRDDEMYDVEQMHLEMIGEIAYDLQLHGLDFKAMNIISGEDEIFSFKRAISRLNEMQSLFYQGTQHRQQTFLPYLRTREERENAENKRREREKRRQKLLNEEREEKVNEKELHDSFKQDIYDRDLRETDWGDEASYITISKEASHVNAKKLRAVADRQTAAPKFGEQHFWGFGWWEHVKNKLKKPKGPTK